uniref:ADP-ribosylation factor n=1 Tax=Erythrolobus australicus TaxID=1077150 RepID=A0A7S1TK32_9RHOD|mmetsp:Transcript_2172/g.5884  ORF Transcript_2172/g.5884 Transcript_2172/m.5884 type:complete len:191 (+) Transcript_2172:176-748(+)|eukprot:CAMPEP_0185841456 /NCGR_PEP_ID=MMETSP1353-20130828/17904_1 /TAXON_ID=1077150 /ORGANISM="Erythrolobus australicus, Strain CCMP3124" /LENGTH=190 /DNA_ID=CAMNT_0028540931 /DNA_START=228 /DNA_END=800 /DNA_ORIENTATION=+
MGGAMSTAYVDRYRQRNQKSGRRGILIIGLDGAGKTTVTYQITLGKHVNTVPTMGHNKESMKYEGRKLDLFDVGGSMLVRETWRLYARAADAIIFVVDSADTARLEEAALTLKKLFYTDEQLKKPNPGLANTTLLILANKQDAPGALPSSKIERYFEPDSLPCRAAQVVPCDARSGENIQAGLMWLVNEI